MMPLAVITGFAIGTLLVLNRPGVHFQVSESERERMLRSRQEREQVLRELAHMRVGGQGAGDRGQTGDGATGAEGPAPVALVPMGGEEMTLINYMQQMNELAAILGGGDRLMAAVDLTEEAPDEPEFELDEEQPELQLEPPTFREERRGYPYLEQLNELAAKHPEGLCRAVDLSEPKEETKVMEEEIDLRELRVMRRPNREATRERRSYREKLSRLNRQAERQAA